MNVYIAYSSTNGKVLMCYDPTSDKWGLPRHEIQRSTSADSMIELALNGVIEKEPLTFGVRALTYYGTVYADKVRSFCYSIELMNQDIRIESNDGKIWDWFYLYDFPESLDVLTAKLTEQSDLLNIFVVDGTHLFL